MGGQAVSGSAKKEESLGQSPAELGHLLAQGVP